MITASRSWLLVTLSLVGLLSACDPHGSAGALGASPVGREGVPADDTSRGRPGPGVVVPTIDPSVNPTINPTVDPLRDPSPDTIDLNQSLPGAGDEVHPSRLRDPSAKDGCRCHLECGPQNDDGSKDCITICEGTGCS